MRNYLRNWQGRHFMSDIITISFSSTDRIMKQRAGTSCQRFRADISNLVWRTQTNLSINNGLLLFIQQY